MLEGTDLADDDEKVETSAESGKDVCLVSSGLWTGGRLPALPVELLCKLFLSN